MGRSTSAMKIARLRPRLGILFVLAVGIPSAALVVIAVRSISNEQALLEKRLERTYLADVDRVVDDVAAEMGRFQDELGAAAPVRPAANPAAALKAWQESSDLVLLPFLLSPDDRLLEPSQSRPLTADELSFLQWNGEFLAGKLQTPILFNVAALYPQEILGGEGAAPAESSAGSQAASEAAAGASSADTAAASPPAATQPAAPEVQPSGAAQAPATGQAAGTSAGPVEQPVTAQSKSAIAMKLDQEQSAALPRDRSQAEPSSSLAALPAAVGPGSEPAPAGEAAPADAAVQQQALEKYKQNEDARRRVLEKAKSEGATPVERLVQPQANPAPAQGADAEATGRDASVEQSSIFVSSQRTFKEIRSGASSGIIPRFINDSLELLYWRRTDNGGTVGCLIDRRVVEQRLVSLVPDPFSGDRILVILDEHATPLIAPPVGQQPADWRRPFVAEELHETLPQWEAASYLADPALFASQVRTRVSLLWLLVGVLFASISGGGAMVLLGLGAELRAAQQRTSFVANVSHELKTPLTSIRMFAEMLREGRQPDPERRRRYLDCMVAESERLARLVNNVLDFSQLEQGRKRYTLRAVDLVALCRGAVEVERPRLEAAGFSAGFRALSRTAVVSGDADALRQVLANLMGNAEKYSGEAKSVEVEAGIDRGKAVFRVLDRGIGIPPAHAGKIFREFYRVDDSLTAAVKGTGLGLSIARRIARDHGGELSFRPREGGGSVFEASFPVGSSGRGPPTGVGSSGKRPPTRGG